MLVRDVVVMWDGGYKRAVVTGLRRGSDGSCMYRGKDAEWVGMRMLWVELLGRTTKEKVDDMP